MMIFPQWFFYDIVRKITEIYIAVYLKLIIYGKSRIPQYDC